MINFDNSIINSVQVTDKKVAFDSYLSKSKKTITVCRDS